MAKAILNEMYYELDEKEIVTNRETPKAIAVDIKMSDKRIFCWVPKSQIIKLDNGKIAVQAWVLKKNLSRGKSH